MTVMNISVVTGGGAGAELVCVVMTAAQYRECSDAWADLAMDACQPNPFMSPHLVGALSPDAEVSVVTAWWQRGQQRTLAGVMTVAKRRLHPLLPVRIASDAVNEHICLSMPVVRRDQSIEILHGLLDAIAQNRQLPQIIFWRLFYAQGSMYDALREALRQRGTTPTIVLRRNRAVLTKPRPICDLAGIGFSSGRLKKIRQYKRRLADAGPFEERVHTSADGIESAIEDFLVLEASGWKGRQGTAIASNPADADFTRAWLKAVAAAGDLMVSELRVDGKPVAMYIWVLSGPAGFAWKIAFDETHARCHPGLVNLEQATRAFAENPRLISADSCHWGTGFVSLFWKQEVEVCGLIFDVRRGGSTRTTMLASAAGLLLAIRPALAEFRVSAQSAWGRWTKAGSSRQGTDES